MSDFQALIESNRRLADMVERKISEIDARVDQAVNSVPQAIIDNFTGKVVQLNPETGNDQTGSPAFKTMQAAVRSVPDGGTILIKLPMGVEPYVFNLNERVEIGSRKVRIQGGYSGIENEGRNAATIKPVRKYNQSLNRSEYQGYFTGEPGGRIQFLFTRIKLPRIVAGSDIEHFTQGSFISGGITVTMHCHSISGDHLQIEDGDSRPMWFMRSSARDGKANLQDLTLSYVNVKTSLASPLIELQYNSGTLRFSAFGSSIADAEGANVTFNSLFQGLSYGTHGYATNLLQALIFLSNQSECLDMILFNIRHNGAWFQNITEEEALSIGIPREEFESAIKLKEFEEVRAKRDYLISLTDWTQMPDAQLSPEKKAEFAAYRQALRDIPQNYSDPDDVVWPAKPEI